MSNVSEERKTYFEELNKRLKKDFDDQTRKNILVKLAQKRNIDPDLLIQYYKQCGDVFEAMTNAIEASKQEVEERMILEQAEPHRFPLGREEAKEISARLKEIVAKSKDGKRDSEEGR